MKTGNTFEANFKVKDIKYPREVRGVEKQKTFACSLATSYDEFPEDLSKGFLKGQEA